MKQALSVIGAVLAVVAAAAAQGIWFDVVETPGDDIGLQATRTMAAVKTAVDGLGDLDVVGPFLLRLGARHVRYGVRTEHFDVVGTALLWTLEQGLGERFTPAVREAWVAAWNIIAGAMRTGMARAEAELEPPPV